MNAGRRQHLFSGVEEYVSVDAPDRSLEIYLNIVFSFSRGVVRIWGAEAASARLLCALNAFRTLDLPNVEGPAAAVLQPLARIPNNSVESLVYVTNVSHLVYAATLLDTFLSETIQFLFLLIPSAMGEGQQVPLRALIDAPSKNEAITQAASARTREIGHRPFADRIHFLRETFGLEITLTPDTTDGLARFSSIHDSAVHDQGTFPVQLDSRGNVISRRSCNPAPMRRPHPSEKTSAEEVRRGIDGYEQAARASPQLCLTRFCGKAITLRCSSF